MKKKTILIWLVCIVAIIFIIFLAREFIVQYDGKLDKSNPMTRDEVIALVKKGEKYTNYYYSPQMKGDTSKTEYYIKDNIVSCFINGNLTSWTNYNEGKQITLWNTEKGKLADVQKEITPIFDSQYGFDDSRIMNQDFSYQYLGQKTLNQRDAIVIQLTNKTEKTKWYIDKETGLILASADFYKQYGLFTQKLYCDRTIKFNVVTEENVKEPNLTDYIIREV